jgi:hypothetical protein
MAARAASARPSGPRFAVASKYVFTVSYCCGSSMGIDSGSSGASLASASDWRTARSSPASLRSLVDTTACLGPNELWMLSVAVDTPPAVVMRLSAKRMLAV